MPQKTLLPEAFQKRLQSQLDEKSYQAFLESYNRSPAQALRLNPLKVKNHATFQEKSPFHLKPVPWCSLGYYYHEEDRPGKHPYHAAGLYYIQEPSAMAVVEVLNPQEGERILDLCAAPGGKSTQIAGYLANEGLLIANEINYKRARILAENLERWGAKNVLITNENPDRLAQKFPEFFDKIVIDAPCSGEGMFRKLPEALSDWTENKVEQCSLMQKDILVQAATMLRPGGTIVYSTCTFSPAENEEQINHFLDQQPQFEALNITTPAYFQRENNNLRLWPHQIEGEGHYIALLRKKENPTKDLENCITIEQHPSEEKSISTKGKKAEKKQKEQENKSSTKKKNKRKQPQKKQRKHSTTSSNFVKTPSGTCQK
ncbi:RsmB/NOP family class I SAM-dependent RNA methyltransferase [Heliorestis convoluta]|uniref:SAM-dependent methyltransferase n=1 Tax=Heliorestis convoluta TaxID=356322 RepID=A0A5Q2MYM8_9FIRM|nr:RsmB/NOP family class I SAM-dependent RNA methyltransferase [Heliorestis convoluta]QGG47071.1 SAM-dependent methyltransferase [Heliorestis convoluta]